MLADSQEETPAETKKERSEKDRRSDPERRQANQEPPEGEKRDQNGDDRRGWVARRQTADWRNKE